MRKHGESKRKLRRQRGHKEMFNKIEHKASLVKISEPKHDVGLVIVYHMLRTGMDGPDFIAKAKEIYPNLPIIMTCFKGVDSICDHRNMTANPDAFVDIRKLIGPSGAQIIKRNLLKRGKKTNSKILLVGDQTDVRHILCSSLVNAGFKVLGVETGMDGLEFLKE